MRATLDQRALSAALSPRAPLALAEQVALLALHDGATVDEAADKGWSYVTAWLRHPANGATGVWAAPAPGPERATAP